MQRKSKQELFEKTHDPVIVGGKQYRFSKFKGAIATKMILAGYRDEKEAIQLVVSRENDKIEFYLSQAYNDGTIDRKTGKYIKGWKRVVDINEASEFLKGRTISGYDAEIIRQFGLTFP